MVNPRLELANGPDCRWGDFELPSQRFLGLAINHSAPDFVGDLHVDLRSFAQPIAFQLITHIVVVCSNPQVVRIAARLVVATVQNELAGLNWAFN